MKDGGCAKFTEKIEVMKFKMTFKVQNLLSEKDSQTPGFEKLLSECESTLKELFQVLKTS